MKKIFAISFLVFFACFTGYVSNESSGLSMYEKPENLKKLIESEQDSIIIIDVRPKNAYEKGHIPSAISMPSSEIMDNLDDLPQEKGIIVYCETGGRAQSVIKKLEEKGYDKLLNFGSYKRWKWEYEKSSS